MTSEFADPLYLHVPSLHLCLCFSVHFYSSCVLPLERWLILWGIIMEWNELGLWNIQDPDISPDLSTCQSYDPGGLTLPLGASVSSSESGAIPPQIPCPHTVDAWGVWVLSISSGLSSLQPALVLSSHFPVCLSPASLLHQPLTYQSAIKQETLLLTSNHQPYVPTWNFYFNPQNLLNTGKKESKKTANFLKGAIKSLAAWVISSTNYPL